LFEKLEILELVGHNFQGQTIQWLQLVDDGVDFVIEAADTSRQIFDQASLMIIL